MAKNSAISWCHHTLNFFIGCTKVPVGPKGACENCYAETYGHRFGIKWGNHPRVQTSSGGWRKVSTWECAAVKTGEPVRVFVNSLSDFWDNQVDPKWRREAFDWMAMAPHVTFMLLTKRPQNILKLWREIARTGEEFPKNVWLGCTVVTQVEHDRDTPWLLIAGAELGVDVLFLSMEPLMEAVEIGWALSTSVIALAGYIQKRGHFSPGLETLRRIGWVITGGESGSHARPSHPDWIRSLRDQCATAGVPFHFKQWGEHVTAKGLPGHLPISHVFDDGYQMVKLGKHTAGRLLDGVEHNGFPTNG